jgi:hypothetical protein
MILMLYLKLYKILSITCSHESGRIILTSTNLINLIVLILLVTYESMISEGCDVFSRSYMIDFIYSTL